MQTLTPIDKQQEKDYNDNSKAPIIHLSALSKYIIPLGSILGPLITWLIWRDENEFNNNNGKEALNFNISIILYKLLAIILGLVLFLSPILVLIKNAGSEDDIIFGLMSIPGLLIFISGVGIIEIAWLVLIIIAAVKSGNGYNFKYPLIINFIK